MAVAKQTIRHQDVHGVLVTPERPTGAGILILPTIFGLNPVAHGIAEAFAGLGLTALLWDHYCGAAPQTDFPGAVGMSRKLSDKTSVAQMIQCLDYMTENLRLKSVGAIGYCLGGRYIFMLAAADRRVKAIAAIYPSIEVPNHPHQDEDAIARAAEVRCPVLLSYPGRDEVTSRDTFQRLQQSLESRTAPTVVQLYPEADHGFLWRPGDVNTATKAVAQPQINTFLKVYLGV
jgi:carboxymethylenebutenolidase